MSYSSLYHLVFFHLLSPDGRSYFVGLLLSHSLIPPFFFFSFGLALVVPDGTSEKSGLGDELGAEEDFLYEEFRSSGHRFGQPGGGGGEQLAINEVTISG